MRITSCAMATWACSVEAPTWCVPYTPGTLHDRVGELAAAARPARSGRRRAPARIPFSRTACSSAASSTTEPRAVLMQVGARLHRRQELRVHQVLGLRGGGDVDGDRVAQPGHLERRLGVGDAEPVGLLVRQAPRPGHHLHPEGPGARGHLPADLAQTRRCPAFGRTARAPWSTRPCPTCRCRSSATWSGIRRSIDEQQSEHQLGDGDRVLARDSWRRRRRDPRRRRHRWCRCRRRRGSPGSARCPPAARPRSPSCPGRSGCADPPP